MREVEVAGNYAYIIDQYAGLRIIDISNIANPFQVCAFNLPCAPNSFYIEGNYAYIADDTCGLRIVDISNPNLPREVGYYLTSYETKDVVAQGNLAFTAEGYWFKILDCSQAIIPNIRELSSSSKEIESAFIPHPSSPTLSASPNPFNSSVAIRFEMRDASSVDLRIYDISGREVWSMVNSQWSTGEHQVIWNAEDMTSGIYFARLSVFSSRSSEIGSQASVVSSQSTVLKLLLLK
jgi:hypothetical protein